MTALPSQVPHANPHIVSAYNICLKLEKSLQEDVEKGKITWFAFESLGIFYIICPQTKD
jgi:hypothetical protein